MQPAACSRMGKEIDTPCLFKELVVVSPGLLLKIEYLFPAELLVESQGIVLENIFFKAAFQINV